MTGLKCSRRGPRQRTRKYYDRSRSGWRDQRTRLFAASQAPFRFSGRRPFAVDGVDERRGELLACAGPGDVRDLARAHADYNTPQTTVTGNMHGMSAAFLCGESGLDGLLVPASASIGSDGKTFGSGRSTRWKSNWCSSAESQSPNMRAIDELGISVLIRKVIERVRAKNGVLHSSCDVIFSIPASRPASAPRCPAERPIARRISPWNCCTIRIWCTRSMGRTQPVPRRSRQDRADRGRAGRQPVRAANHRSADAEQCGIAGQRPRLG